MDNTQFNSIYQKVQSYIQMTQEEARKLFECVKRLPPSAVIVEIGTYKGGSAEIMATATDGVVYTIDNILQPYQSVLENIKFIKGNSEDIISAWDKPIDMLFIDGSHKYEDVMNDIKGWLPKVKEGGIICFHDFGSHTGITEAVSEAVVKRIGLLNNSLFSIIK